MPKKSDESKIENLKKEYSRIQKKYSLPSFEKLNEDFGIEKASESETEIPIREIRKQISEKIYNYLRLIETLINPVNAPMSILSVVKTLNSEDRDKLAEVYKKFVKSELQLVLTDIEFSEERETEFIKNAYKTWQEAKKEMIDVLSKVEKNLENKTEANGRKYFG
ncbi:hypothetical protein HY449_02165 [Candidatus Pacearchaeota archaeon]|nr:hypothetical protein [Candidatus Pacearchaeota archaeon]